MHHILFKKKSELLILRVHESNHLSSILVAYCWHCLLPLESSEKLYKLNHVRLKFGLFKMCRQNKSPCLSRTQRLTFTTTMAKSSMLKNKFKSKNLIESWPSKSKLKSKCGFAESWHPYEWIIEALCSLEIVFRGSEGHLTASTIQFEKEKKTPKPQLFLTTHCTELEPLCIIKQPLTKKKTNKKLKESSASRFRFSSLFMKRSVWGPPYWAGDLFFLRSHRGAIWFCFLQHLTLTWQSLSVCVENVNPVHVRIRERSCVSVVTTLPHETCAKYSL